MPTNKTLNMENAEYYFDLRVEEMEQGNIIKGKEYFEKALGIQDDYVFAWNGLGNVYLVLKEFQKAIEHYQKAIEIKADYSLAWNSLGNVYYDSREFQKAIEHYKKTLEIQDDYFNSWHGLGNVYHNLGNYPEAIKHYQKALEIQDDFVFTWYCLGKAYSKNSPPKLCISPYLFQSFYQFGFLSRIKGRWYDGHFFSSR